MSPLFKSLAHNMTHRDDSKNEITHSAIAFLSNGWSEMKLVESDAQNPLSTRLDDHPLLETLVKYVSLIFNSVQLLQKI